MQPSEIHAWREAAVLDGWTCRPIQKAYPELEPIAHAATLEKDGWSALLITRDPLDSSIYVWAPDRLSVEVPKIYSMQNLIKNTRICSLCHAEDIDTQRYSFAGRCCASCLPDARKKYEYPGWDN